MTGPRRLHLGDLPRAPRRGALEAIRSGIEIGILLALAATGFAMHFPEASGWIIPLPLAVAAHDVLAVLLMAISIQRLIVLGIAGPARPSGPLRVGSARSPVKVWAGRALLGLLLPFQAVTGFLMAFGNRRLDTLEGLLGLPVLGPAHTFGAYLTLALLIFALALSWSRPGREGARAA
jgi:hypothetical protein